MPATTSAGVGSRPLWLKHTPPAPVARLPTMSNKKRHHQLRVPHQGPRGTILRCNREPFGEPRPLELIDVHLVVDATIMPCQASGGGVMKDVLEAVAKVLHQTVGIEVS